MKVYKAQTQGTPELVCEIVCESTDIVNLPTMVDDGVKVCDGYHEFGAGTAAVCVDTGDVYLLDNTGWHEV